MTRKDFQLIADVIKENASKALHIDVLRNGETAIEAATQELAYSFARALNDANPRFNIGLFLKACGTTS